MKKMVFVSIAICYAISVMWRVNEYQFRLKHVPSEMQVTKILFANEDSWGFGPGGAETGFIMYKLPDEIAKKVKAQGVSYLSSIRYPTQHFPHDHKGKYREWHETPVSGPRGVPFIEQGPDCLYCIYVDHEAEKAFKDAAYNPGSFYAYGRWGMILVAPTDHKVFYAYTG